METLYIQVLTTNVHYLLHMDMYKFIDIWLWKLQWAVIIQLCSRPWRKRMLTLNINASDWSHDTVT